LHYGAGTFVGANPDGGFGCNFPNGDRT
jgi:hypothetical protein